MRILKEYDALFEAAKQAKQWHLLGQAMEAKSYSESYAILKTGPIETAAKKLLKSLLEIA